MTTAHERYPGTKPFEPFQKDIFKGRDEDIEKLSRLIKLEQLVVLHGKSGLGKSSLLNAGVIPLINDNNFEPVRVRFKSYMEEGDKKSPLTITREFVRKQHNPIDTFLDKLIENEESLWHDVKEHQILLKGKKGIIFIFDQFEELFSYPEHEVDHFAQNLWEVLLGIIPQRYWDALDNVSQDEDSLLPSEHLNIFQSELNIKAVIAIRSDKLHFLDDIKEQLPSIHHNTYPLEPLSRQGAISAIIEPAQLEGDFKTPSFTYSPEALSEIINFLAQGGKEDIEATQLQIICEALEEKAHNEDSHIVTVAHTHDLNQIVENYVEEKIKALPEEEWEKAQLMIQEALVYAEGDITRRLSRYEGVLKSEYGISQNTLNDLVNGHLLRRELSRGDAVYELSHDTLLAPVIKARDERRNEERKAEENRKFEEFQSKERKRLEEEQREQKERIEAERNREKQKYLEEKRKAKIRARYTGLIVMTIISGSLIFAFFQKRNNIQLAAETSKALEAQHIADSTSVEAQQNADQIVELYKDLQESTEEVKIANAALNNNNARIEKLLLEANQREIQLQRTADNLIKEQALSDVRNGDDFLRYQEHDFAKTAYEKALNTLKEINDQDLVAGVKENIENQIRLCNAHIARNSPNNN